jgi:hypothetical protein
MKLEITIPTSLSEIKLSQYLKFLAIAEQNEESDFLHHKMIQIFCNVELKYIDQFKRTQLIEIVNSINSLFENVPEFKNRFELNGVEYGFIPNLEDITQGEYIDLDNYLPVNSDMNKAMAVMFRPIKQRFKDKYIIEDYAGSSLYAEKMLDAPLDVVLGARVFFYHLGNELLKSTLNYLEEKVPKTILANKPNLGKDGDGIALSMLSLKGMLEDLMKLPDFRLINV